MQGTLEYLKRLLRNHRTRFEARANTIDLTHGTRDVSASVRRLEYVRIRREHQTVPAMILPDIGV